MTLDDFKKIASKMPDLPGVYFFLDENGEILYIGKATSLRSRVRSYFSKELANTRGASIVQMVEKAQKLKFAVSDSVLEALILEANLIRKHKPQYNVRDKDDKSFNHVVITDEAYPRVLLVRGKELADGSFPYKAKYSFGPFPHGSAIGRAMKIIRKIFPFRTTCTPFDELSEPEKAKAKPCFDSQIGMCPGVCIGKVTREDYLETVRQIKLFFEGKKKKLLRDMEKEMNERAEAHDFERAKILRDRIFALNHIYDVSLIEDSSFSLHEPGEQAGEFRIEAYDIAHLSGKNVVGVMVAIEDGQPNKSQYRKFRIMRSPGVNDAAALKEVLKRRFNHPEWPRPNLIVVDGSKIQINAAQEVLKERNLKIEVVSVVKDERHRPREILGDRKLRYEKEAEILLANSEAHRFAISYHRFKRDRLRG